MENTIRESSVKELEYVRLTWHATIPKEHSLEDILRPDYWRHKARSIKPGEVIEVVAEDRSFYGRLFVHRANPVELFVKVIEIVRFDKVAPVLTDYTIEWKGPKRKYSILIGDKIVSDGHDTKEDASAALAANDLVIKTEIAA